MLGENKILYKEESFSIIGTAFKVYNEMGCGFLEPVYQECMELELSKQEISFASQKQLSLKYDGIKLKQTYKTDLICYDKIIVELKAITNILDEHRAQVLNYLNATKIKLGLLVNFGSHPKLEYERFVL